MKLAVWVVIFGVSLGLLGLFLYGRLTLASAPRPAGLVADQPVPQYSHAPVRPQSHSPRVHVSKTRSTVDTVLNYAKELVVLITSIVGLIGMIKHPRRKRRNA
jgi:hypothetical protein